MPWHDFWLIDFAPLTAALLSSLCCCLPGNLLVLRRQSMMVDAISHIVLPGMVVAFLIFGTVSFVNMFWGAMVAAILGIMLIETLSRIHDSGAVIGMVFSVFFAAGVLLLELFVDTRVHLDVMHILFGSIESVYWAGLGEGRGFFSPLVLAAAPTELLILMVLLLFLVFCLTLLYKEMVLVSFDSLFAHTQRVAPRWMGYGLSTLVTLTVVAAFKLVGLILIVGMFIIPPVLAAAVTRRLHTRILMSLIMAAGLCIFGYGLAVYVPPLLGAEFSLNVGGTIVAFGALTTFILLLFKRSFS